MKLELLYIVDPMCSWCYAFAPAMQKLITNYKDRIELRIIAGGLSPFETEIADEEFQNMIISHWHHASESSNRVFDYGFFNAHKNFCYDTAPCDRAIGAVNMIDPSKTFAYLSTLHESFFRAGNDPTRQDTLEHVAHIVGLDSEAFKRVYASKECEQNMLDDFQKAIDVGCESFPSLYMKDGENYKIISHYESYEKLEEIVLSYFEY